MLEQMLSRYALETEQQRHQALREVMQEIALAGLYRGGFFEQAAFYGGTCLRIFYGLPRYSEDLDFSLLRSQNDFSLAPYFSALEAEFAALGIGVTITQKRKSAEAGIESAFLKNDTQVAELAFGDVKVKIKFEVDTHPPLGFNTEERLLIEPFSFYVKCFSLPDLYAGKMHALLFRKWKNRVKGRDWFDFEWYVRRGVALHLAHFNERAIQSGDLEHAVDADGFIALVRRRIESVGVELARQDAERFIGDVKALDIWSNDYFLQLSERMRFV
ncbi:nucleotidyl transferase AbiEii/AbiGii toxin family protein [Desulfurispirillum indicum]|uniref:nucleotidyl transferase AbiEii/AbiGii toxin family protein n=1 Tax=Desulfurispirillum indicum TaxID=936456 RepID=UPI001CFB90A9|nr:nucleotidyl transferase AbiEii/AbiGii toxin family protein [Desulfurispirillum indicum]UCZ56516.1 nucleotidyl transferase AbiEii/AbiGii toxin family protein [Desulfurispirillum indicum]